MMERSEKAKFKENQITMTLSVLAITNKLIKEEISIDEYAHLYVDVLGMDGSRKVTLEDDGMIQFQVITCFAELLLGALKKEGIEPEVYIANLYNSIPQLYEMFPKEEDEDN